MTGHNTTPGEKLRAIFLAVLMVGSAFAVGVAFTGGAAANVGNSSLGTISNQDMVGDTFTVNISVSAGDQVTVENYVDGEVKQTIEVTDNGTNDLDDTSGNIEVELTAGKTYNGSSKVVVTGPNGNTDTTMYDTSNYLVELEDGSVTQGETTAVEGTIYEYPGDPVNDHTLDYELVYDADVSTQDNVTHEDVLASSDTGSGEFRVVRTFNKVDGEFQNDYPRDNVTVGSDAEPSYVVYVMENNTAADADSEHDGYAQIDTRLDVSGDVTNQDGVVLESPTYGQTVDIRDGMVANADGGLADYPLRVEDPGGTTRKTTTSAQDGSFGFTLELNDAGTWNLGTNAGAFIDYVPIEVAAQQATVDYTVDGDNRANFSHDYTIEVTDSNGNPIDVGSDEASGYVNVTGPFDSFSLTNTANATQVDSVSGEYYHIETTTGVIEFTATPTGDIGSEMTASLENTEGDGLENTVDAADTPASPDYVGSDSVTVVSPDELNLQEFRLKDQRVEGWGSTSIAVNLFGDNDGGPNRTIDVLPLATDPADRVVNGHRLGNDTYQNFDGMTAYLLQFELRDEANDAIAPGTGDGQISSISIEGAGVDGTIEGDSGSLSTADGSQNVLSEAYGPWYDGDGQYTAAFRPITVDETDETIEFAINVSGTGTSEDIVREVNVDGLYIPEFTVNGDSTDTVQPNSNSDIAAVVRDIQKDNAFINNGRVRVTQDGDPLGSIDARTANVNNGAYEFENLSVGPRGIDTDDDGIADDTSELVFTAYQYTDADNDQALNQNEVDQATVKTLDLAMDKGLQVEFLEDDNNTSPYVEYKDDWGQTVLTRGVEYDSLAFELTDSNGDPVNLTDGVGQKIDLNDLPKDFAKVTTLNYFGDEVSGEVVFDEDASRPGEGYYVIDDIATVDTLQSDNDGAAETDGVFSFYDFGVADQDPKQFWLEITTPDLSQTTEDINTDPFTTSEGQFQVGDPVLETDVTGVTGPGINGVGWADLDHNSGDNFTDVSGVEELTIGIDRTYRVNATYQTLDGTPINGSAFNSVEVAYAGSQSGEPVDVDFTKVDSVDSDGEFQFDIRVLNSTSDGDFTPLFDLSATDGVNYEYTSPYGDDAATPTATIVGGPDAQNPRVEVYDESGSELPESEETGHDLLANDVTQTLRVEAFPADPNDVPLESGLDFGFRSSDPIAENIAGTTTNSNITEGEPLITNRVLNESYSEGQVGFVSLTPTGTGQGILALIDSNDGEGVVVKDTNAEDILFDVNRANLQTGLEFADTVAPGENLMVTVTDETGDPIPRASVSLINPSGNLVAGTETTAGEDGVATIAVPSNIQSNVDYTVKTGPAGYAPTEQNVLVAVPATFDVADLAPSTAEVTRGATVNVSAEVSNIGDLEGGEMAYFVIEDPAGEEVFNESQSVTLAGGDSTTVEFSAATAALDAGDYTHTIKVGDASQTGDLTINPAPAVFEVTSLSAPDTVTRGESITVSSTIANTGNENGTQTVEFRLAGETIANESVSLTPGDTRVLSFTVDTSEVDAGVYEHGVYTQNDSQTAQLTVDPAPANFEVSGLTAPTEVYENEQAEVTATITNTGDESAQQIVQYRVGDDVVAQQIVELGADESQPVSFTLDALDYTPGELQHGIYTDDDSQVGPLTITEIVTEFDADLTLYADPGQEITGTTNAPAGTTYTVQLTGPGFIPSQEVTVTEDGTFSATFDLSSLNGGDQIEASIGNEASQVYTVEPSQYATIDIGSQVSSNGDQVSVNSVYLPDGGYAVIHNADGDIIGNSLYLEAGTHEDVVVQLASPLESDTTSQLTAMAHMDDGDEQFTASDDGAYMTVDEDPVTDTASVEVPAEPANFDVSALSAPGTVTQGDDVTASVTIENTGDETATQTVEFRLGGSVVAEEDVTLDGGESQTAEFTVSTADVSPGTYTHGVYSDDDSQTAQLTVEAQSTPTDTPEPDTDTTTEGDGDGPGFGIAAALVALLGAALLAVRRNN